MRVLYVQYTNPGAYPPLVRGAQLLAESGAQVLMLGIRIPNLDPLTADAVRDMTVRLMDPAPEGWRLKAHYGRYAAWVAREGTAWRPDWIYASDVLSAPIALMLGTITGARMVYHEHDAPSPAHESWTMRRCLAARRRLVRQAAIVVVPNAERAERLSREVAAGREVHTVWNCPRRPATDAPLRPPLGDGVSDDDERSAPLRVVFRGSINRERLPSTVIEGVAAVGEHVTLDIAGYETAGSRGYVRELLSLAARLGAGTRVRALGTVVEADLGRTCAQSDVGLALMPRVSADENMRHMVGASNKVFEYLSFGVTPLVTDLPDWQVTFGQPGYAITCNPDDVESVRRSLAWAADHRPELRAMAERGFARLRTDWNYEAQFAPVLRAIRASSSEAAPLGGEEVRCAS